MRSNANRRWQLIILLMIGIAPFELNGFYNPRLSPGQFWITEITTWLVMPLVVVFIALRRGMTTREELGLHIRVRVAPPFVFPMLLIAVPILVYYVDSWSVRKGIELFPTNHGAVEFSYRDLLPQPGPETGLLRVLALAFMVLTAGFVEEIYYRGLMSMLFPSGCAGSIAYVVVSSVVFSSAHWEGGIVTLIQALIFGVLAAVFFRATRNIWALVVAHIIVDLGWLS